MTRYVLDASAVMAFFDARPGGEKVRDLLTKAGEAADPHRFLLMSVVNWGEVYYSVWRDRGEAVANQKMIEIAQLPVEVVDVDMELTKLAASFKARHKLPYTDAFAAALARQRKGTVVTTDKDFAEVEKEVSVLWAGGRQG